jgi:gliding motility-associated-like protein
MPVRNIDEVGTYKVNITNICESKEIAYKIEWASPELVIDLGPDHTIDLGEPFYLDPTLPDQANFTLHWSVKPDQMIHCYDCPQLDVIPLDNSTYTLTLIDEHECTYADSVHVMVQKAYHIYIPNSFSPNRDGLNDVLLVYGQPGTQVSYFRIYSRWGGLVFESTNSLVNEHSSGWNGQINGKMAPSDVYLWTSKIRFIDGEEKNYAGDVTVLR